jgi:CelD/BcsL family acetyltransferase involved in cellulose biosynthesis
MVQISYVRSPEAVDAVEWRRLAERAGHVFATREWLLTWWGHYPKAGRPLVGLARADGEPTAIVPLSLWWRHGLPILRFAGHGPSDQLGPICTPFHDPAAAAAVTAAVDAIPLRRFVLLAEHVASDHGFGQLTGARELYREPSLVLRFEHATWEELLQERGRNFRQQARRFPRKLEELGTVSYRLAADPDRLQHDMDTLFRLHRQRWDGVETPFLQAADFHREFAAQALAQGWLRLWFLDIAGKPIGALYGFRFAGAESAYQAGRDPAFRDYPVGFVLLAHAVREALAERMGEFRLLRGGAAYKARFANTDLGLETYGLARGAPARALLSAALAARGRSLGLRRILDWF